MEATLTAADSSIAANTRETIALSVPDIVCGNCIRIVERTLQQVEGVIAARANLTARRVSVVVNPSCINASDLTAALKRNGYSAAEIAEQEIDDKAARSSDYIPRVGVAGFAAANIMLLSVSVWSGQSSDMDSSIKELFHWLSALIALPAIAYAGQPFFRSAAAALRSRRLNMDVPISLGVILATAMSLFQTMRGSEQVYFDAATALLFFLLIGRVLDERMRIRARGAAENLLSLKAVDATFVGADGSIRKVLARMLKPGDLILVSAGERLAADGAVAAGISEINESLITGETVPRAVTTGDHVHAGTINGNGVLQIRVTAADKSTLLNEIGRLMLAAEQSKGRYVRLADRAARLYAPAVHVLGLSTFLVWMLAGATWENALTYAIAVLIITCPCALALAVPAVQVAALSRLFGKGILVKAADGLERLADVDYLVFDKTGTLTTGDMAVADIENIDRAILQRAASLAAASRHPYAQALVRAAREKHIEIYASANVSEQPGLGISTNANGFEEKLGSAQWVGADSKDSASLWYVRKGEKPISFKLVDELRTDAQQTIKKLENAGYGIELLSGDRKTAVRETAELTGIERWTSEIKPDQKLARIAELKSLGHKPLMVGDGLNDAPALAAGHASISPASAVDVAQTAADAVFQGKNLAAVVEALVTAKAAHRLALQNFAIAILYNLAFVPLAMSGRVTPLVAALAMSSSSIIVTANAIRLRTMHLRCEESGET